MLDCEQLALDLGTPASVELGWPHQTHVLEKGKEQMRLIHTSAQNQTQVVGLLLAGLDIYSLPDPKQSSALVNYLGVQVSLML